MKIIHKKIDIEDLDIPKDDVECWVRYPKQHWVYDLSRLLESQKIEWSPFMTDLLSDKEINNKLQSEPGYIYLKKSQGNHTITELYIIRGEIKFLRHIDPDTNKELSSLYGEIELRLNSFVILYFQKFSGVINVEMDGNEIYKIQLRPYIDIVNETNDSVIKLVRRIYKKAESQ